jgi:hypothetical protein
MKFKKYLIESGLDLLKPIDPSEVEDRELEGFRIDFLEKIKTTKHTILTDGSYHIQGNLNFHYGNLDVSYNNLKSLKDLPIKISIVDGYFRCDNNNLTNLEGAPKKVGGNFICHYNKLTSLEGAPEKVGGYFYCNYNKLTSLEGAPNEVDGDFYVRTNPGKNGNGFTEEDVRAVSNVKGQIRISY